MNSKEAMNPSAKNETFVITVTSFPFYFSNDQVREVLLLPAFSR